MISVQRIVYLTRVKQKDLNETRFSDWDILNALNEGIRLMSVELSMQNCDFLETAQDYSGEETRRGAELPEDFAALRRVLSHRGYPLSPAAGAVCAADQYVVSGNKLYARVAVKLLYRRILREVDLDGEIDLPEVFTDAVVKLTGLILNNAETDILTQFVANSAKYLIPRRRYANIARRMPFHV